MMGFRPATRDHYLESEFLKLSALFITRTVSSKTLQDYLDKIATILVYYHHYFQHKEGRASLEVIDRVIDLSLIIVMVVARRSQTCFALAELLSSLCYYRYETHETLVDLEISTFWLKVTLSLFHQVLQFRFRV